MTIKYCVELAGKDAYAEGVIYLDDEDADRSDQELNEIVNQAIIDRAVVNVSWEKLD